MKIGTKHGSGDFQLPPKATINSAATKSHRYEILRPLLILTNIILLSSIQAEIDYERQIAPIFRSYCAGCHNETDYEGEFSLETFASLREGGDKGDPVKEGNAEDSYLIKVIEGRAKPLMPPKDEPPVPATELALLKQWIDGGAAGPEADRSLFSHLAVPDVPPAATNTPITALAYSPRGDWGARAVYGLVEVFALDSGEIRHRIEDLPGKVNAVTFSPDGNELLLASGITGLNGTAQLWNLENGSLAKEFGGHRDVLYDAIFSPDGKWIATAGYDAAIRIWDRVDGTLAQTITVHQGAIFDLAFHPNSKILASASADETVKLWRVSDGVRLDTLNQPQGTQVAVTFTADGQHVLSAGEDKRLHIWDLVSTEEPALNPVKHSRFAHEAAITALLCMPDRQHLISAAADRSLKVWSLPDLIEVHAYDPLPDVVASLAALPEQEAFVAARMDGTTQVYHLTQSTRSSKKTPANIAKAQKTAPDIQEPTETTEAEPNNQANEAMPVTLPVKIRGNINAAGDEDLYRIEAQAGRRLLLGVNAARSKSKLDSKIEVLDLQGQPVEQVRLHATRDSWLTFRGKDSNTSDDFRVHNWAEMELNEYLYANGEVVKLWLYPRGPDSGFKVYPGAGKRHTAFFTTALAHPLGEPCYTVMPLPAGSDPPPNGLPVFPVYWENDDDPMRRWGNDSQLWFDPPETGEYLVKIRDVRGFGGSKDYHYDLTIRDLKPDFEISIGGKDAKVSPGSGREITFTVERHEGFAGEVRIDLANLPEGFSVGTPVIIEAGQRSAIGVLRADVSAVDPNADADQAVSVWATATIAGNERRKEIGNLGNIQLGPPAKVSVKILREDGTSSSEGPLQFHIRPGETIQARVRATRHDFGARIEFGNEDSGRNLPHGLYVDNIGLNGLLIVEGQTEREFFITAAPWVPPCERLFHLRAKGDGGQASAPAIIRVLPKAENSE